MDSGVHQGAESGTITVFRETIQFPGAPWLKLHFSDYNLGKRSFITVTSLEDGGQQRLDTTSISQWHANSAFFNGDAVSIELHVAARESDIFFRIKEVTVGEWLDEPDADYSIESICGTDNRTPSTEARVARLTFVSAAGNPGTACTAWLISNGALLTAGHCVDFDPDQSGPLLPDGVLDLDGNDVIEFGVPNSLNTGTLVFADPDDQYAINLTSVTWNYDGEGQGLGKDWAVFAVFPNANTGNLPHEVQGFYRMTNGNPSTSSTIRITGHGTDSTPTQTRNQIQQTHSGPWVSENSSGADRWHRYQVDTTGGNSGSPIIWTNNGFTIGIHTNAGCAADGTGANSGTSFEHNALETAVDNFPGNNTVYADLSRFGALENGTIFHPYDTVSEAVAAVASNGVVSIVAGSYTKAANTLTIGDDGKSMTIEAPVGSVIIGN
jgi:V8-like Glu-specific endopeptidase